MDTEFQWEGHNIQINCMPALKYLWMATETIVRVDDVEIGRAGGFRFTDKISGNFNNHGHPSELVLEMKVDIITLASVPYTLTINGNLISQGRLKINNWPLFFAPTAIISACACCPGAMIIFFMLANNSPK